MLAVTPPGGEPQMILMDANNPIGQHLDPTQPMNVIYGEASVAPDALRIDFAGDTAGTRRVFDEAGPFNNVFTTPGTYEPSFSFNNNVGNAFHSDIYLLVDTLDVEPPSIPEPGTLALFTSALGGIGLVRRRRRQAS